MATIDVGLAATVTVPANAVRLTAEVVEETAPEVALTLAVPSLSAFNWPFVAASKAAAPVGVEESTTQVTESVIVAVDASSYVPTAANWTFPPTSTELCPVIAMAVSAFGTRAMVPRLMAADPVSNWVTVFFSPLVVLVMSITKVSV